MWAISKLEDENKTIYLFGGLKPNLNNFMGKTIFYPLKNLDRIILNHFIVFKFFLLNV